MKPRLHGFAVVTATVDPDRSMAYRQSWRDRSMFQWTEYVMVCRDHYEPDVWDPEQNRWTLTYRGYGVVGPYAAGVRRALADKRDVICLLHDDVEILQDGWDRSVTKWFATHPQCGLAGFGGGIGVGSARIYQDPYDPMQLARQGFVSNLVDAEAHGVRSVEPVQVACLDGFCQIARSAVWRGQYYLPGHIPYQDTNLLQQLFDQGVIHHAYDSALGMYAARLGWQAWMLPVACRHLGGQTAVGDSRYQQWLQDHDLTDQQVWERSHRVVYEEFRDVLPIRT